MTGRKSRKRTKNRISNNKYSTFSFECNHYSAPEHLVGQKVELRIYAEEVVAIYNGKIVATHSRCFDNGKWFIDIFHYLKTLKKKPGALKRSTALLQTDTHTKTIYEKYYSSNPKEFLLLLDTIKENGSEKVLEALKALALISPGDFSAAKVKEICEVKSLLKETKNPENQICMLAEKSLVNYDLLMMASNRQED